MIVLGKIVCLDCCNPCIPRFGQEGREDNKWISTDYLQIVISNVLCRIISNTFNLIVFYPNPFFEIPLSKWCITLCSTCN